MNVVAVCLTAERQYPRKSVHAVLLMRCPTATRQTELSRARHRTADSYAASTLGWQW